MRTWERTVFMGVGAIFLLALIVLVGLIMKNTGQKIVASFPTPTGYEFQFFEMRLLAPDLPRGYVGRNLPIRIEVDSGIGEQHVYEASQSNSSVHLVQQIIIFHETELAEERLKLERMKWPKFNFVAEGDARTRMPHADYLVWACSDPVVISGIDLLRTRYCITIAVYREIYVVLRGRVVEGKLLTMDKYLELLGLLDERITKVQVNAAQATATP